MSLLEFDCVVPAAGLSSRMGANKLLSEFGGKPLVLWSIENALDACRRVILVLGHDAPAVRAILPGDRNLTVVMNPAYEKGMLTSIARGARAVSSDWFFVAPADMPFVKPDLYRKVAATAGDGPGNAGSEPTDIMAWVPDLNGRRGHPVLINSQVIPALDREANRESPLKVMHRFLATYETAAVPVDNDGATIDIDTTVELDRFESRAGEIDA